MVRSVQIKSRTSRQKASGIWQEHISPPAPGLPIALESALMSESEALPVAVTDRKSLVTAQLKKTTDKTVENAKMTTSSVAFSP